MVGFEKALAHLKLGGKAHRNGWNAAGMWVHVQRPDKHSKMGAPYIYIKTVDDRLDEKLVPWVPSTDDLFCEDWILIDTRESQANQPYVVAP